MAVKLEKTKTAGVYKRGGRYVVIYRYEGKQRKAFARTYDEARNEKHDREAQVAKGTYRDISDVSFGEYAREWLNTYTGRTSTGLRGSTLEGYRWSVDKAIPYFDGKVPKLAQGPATAREGISRLAARQQAAGSPAIGRDR